MAKNSFFCAIAVIVAILCSAPAGYSGKANDTLDVVQNFLPENIDTYMNKKMSDSLLAVKDLAKSLTDSESASIK